MGFIQDEHNRKIRVSSAIYIMEKLRALGVDIIIYGSLVSDGYGGSRVIDDPVEFIRCSNLTVANRFSDELKGCREKVYSRDLFGKD